MYESSFVTNTNLYKELIKDCENYLPKIDTFNNIEIPPDIFDEFQFYIHDVGYWLFQLDWQISELFFSIKFLKNFDYKKFNNSSRPNRIDYLEYTISNFYIRYASIKDKCLQLINSVFHIGINDKDVNESIIINNIFVNRSIVLSKYKSVAKLINSDLKIRNSIIHRDMYTDSDIHKLRFFYSSNNSSIDPSVKHFRSVKLTEYINKSESEFNKKFGILMQDIYKYLDALFIVYMQKKNEFIKRGFGT